MASFEMAAKIVDLLSRDPGTASVRNTYSVSGSPASVSRCRHCGKTLKLSHRQFCSRQCYTDHLAKEAATAPPPPPPPVATKLGRGKRFSGPARQWVEANEHLSVPELKRGLVEQFGLRVSDQTLYKIVKEWRARKVSRR